ncbi:MAG: SIS domain-containing protein [Armatimonadota bacterium]|nr:SIS domain-containing protein [Armatimonadota bacterium]
MSYMLDEIRQQPEVIANLVEHNSGNARMLAAEMRKRDINLMILAARGTSDNAATFGKYIFEMVNGIPVALAAPSIITLYGARLRLDKALVIGISQSGKATDVVEYLDRAKNMGALTAAITNEPESDLANIADYTLLCHAGVERGIAATKTYTATLGSIYMLAAAISDRTDLLDGLRKTADLMQQALSCEDRIAVVSERYRYMEECFIIARGLNQGTAAETALKMSETSYLGAKPYSAADFMHGPIAVIHEGFPCFLIAPDGKAFDVMIETADKLKEKGAELAIIANNQEILSKATVPIPIPVQMDELFSPLVYIIAGQLLAYHLALTKGYDPDRPRGLSKVTLTR